jgi:hypothetical protein
MPKFLHHKWVLVQTRGHHRDDKRELIFKCRRCEAIAPVVIRKCLDLSPPTSEELKIAPFDRDCNLERVRRIMEA